MGKYLDYEGLNKYTQIITNWVQYNLELSRSSNYTAIISTADVDKLQNINHPLVVNLDWITTSTATSVSLAANTGAIDPCTGNATPSWVADLYIKTSDKKVFNANDRGIIVKVGTNKWSLIT